VIGAGYHTEEKCQVQSTQVWKGGLGATESRSRQATIQNEPNYAVAKRWAETTGR